MEQKIVPSLWFDTQAEEAAKLYTSLFKNSRIKDSLRYSEAGREIHRKNPGEVMTVDYELDGFKFTALNGGPDFKFNPSISFFANCESKEEVDALWEELSQDGSVLMPLGAYPFSDRYGWLADRFGLSWQVYLAWQPPATSWAQRERIAQIGEADLPALSLQILKALRTKERLTIAQLASITRANRNTLKVRLRELVADGRIRQHGKARATWYSL